MPRKSLIGTSQDRCPYCEGKNIFKKGRRKKKLEIVQLWYCKDCQKVFTPQIAKGKTFPLRIILDGLSFYNIGYTLEDSCRFIKEQYGIKVVPTTLSNWVEEYKDLCKYSRLRNFGLKLFSPNQVIQSISLYHRQIYKFRIHQAKLVLLLNEDLKNQRFWPLKEFLEAVFAECPHHLFKESLRISEVGRRSADIAKLVRPSPEKVSGSAGIATSGQPETFSGNAKRGGNIGTGTGYFKFNIGGVLIREKHNFANRIANLLLQAVKDNKLRHEALQKFMIANDSVTVATEVPVYLLPEDVEHMESQLGFEIPVKIDKVLTGHIDLVQIRNGAVHILDYKDRAAKERPIEQLTLYALGLSRLTGLRLYDFKCGWFDENNYFEFFPLHVVYKLKERRPRVPKNQRKLIEIRKSSIQ